MRVAAAVVCETNAAYLSISVRTRFHRVVSRDAIFDDVFPVVGCIKVVGQLLNERANATIRISVVKVQLVATQPSVKKSTMLIVSKPVSDATTLLDVPFLD